MDIETSIYNEPFIGFEDYSEDILLENISSTSIIDNSYFNFELNRDESGYILSALDKKNLPANLVLPGEYNGKPVTNIKHNGFAKCENIVRVYIPNSVISIDSTYDYSYHGAFSECRNLSIVEFQDNSKLKYIGSYAFSKCTSLESIILPKSIKTISGFAFNLCHKDLQVYITATAPPKLGAHVFGSATFYVHYGSLCCYKSNFHWKSFAKCIKPLPKNIPISLGYFSFNLNNDAQSYSISTKNKAMLPNNLIMPSYYNKLPITVVESSAFSLCFQITDIYLPEKLIIVKNLAFYSMSNVKKISIPNTVEIVETAAFANVITTYPDGEVRSNSKVEHIIWGENSRLNYIGVQAFWGHPLMKEFTIPSSVTVIEDNAIGGCGFETINIPANVRSIAENPFYCCRYLKLITVDKGNRFFTSIDGVLFNKSLTTLISYPCGSDNYYFNVPKEVSIIYKGIFKYAFKLRCVYMNSDTPPLSRSYQELYSYVENTLKIYVQDEQLNAYKNSLVWRHMKANIYPKSIIENGFAIIDNTIIQYVANDYVINIPSKISNIQDGAFNLCHHIKSFTLENNDSFAVIDDVLFSKDGTKLILYPKGKSEQDYIMPINTEIIGAFAFESCPNLNRIQFTNNLTSILNNSFNNTLNLENAEVAIDPDTFEFSTTPTISFGENLSYIGSDWYQVLSKIIIMRFYSTIPPTLKSIFPPTIGGEYPIYIIEYVYVPKESYDLYKNWNRFSLGKYIVPI